MVSLLDSFPGYGNVRVSETQRVIETRAKDLCYKCKTNPRWERPNGELYSYCLPCTRVDTKLKMRRRQQKLADAGLRPPLRSRAGHPHTILCPRCKINNRAPSRGKNPLQSYCKGCTTEISKEYKQRKKRENANRKQQSAAAKR